MMYYDNFIKKITEILDNGYQSKSEATFKMKNKEYYIRLRYVNNFKVKEDGVNFTWKGIVDLITLNWAYNHIYIPEKGKIIYRGIIDGPVQYLKTFPLFYNTGKLKLGFGTLVYYSQIKSLFSV